MADQLPAQAPVPPQAWAELAIKLLSLLEAVVPALLVTWNDQLQGQVAAAKEQRDFAEARLKGELDAKKIGDDSMGLGRRALLDRALSRAKSAPI